MTEQTPLSAQEIIDLSKRFTLFDWQAQAKAKPIPVERAEGVYFWTPDGKRYLDFNSQLMGVNIGHGDRRVIEAIEKQARDARLHQPVHGHEMRARLGEKLAEPLPGDMEKIFFTLGGAEANENAIRMARAVHGPAEDPRPVPLATTARRRARSTLTGDPRRWPNEPGRSPAWCTSSTRTTAPFRTGGRRRDGARRPARRRSSSRARRRSRRSSWSPSPARTGS